VLVSVFELGVSVSAHDSRGAVFFIVKEEGVFAVGISAEVLWQFFGILDLYYEVNSLSD
jgi:hypothetical protein